MERFKNLVQLFGKNSQLELAILIGSRINNTETSASDWDIALQWQRDLDEMSKLAYTEQLRKQLFETLGIPGNKIDFINIPGAGLAMSENIANQGIVSKGENTLALSHFLTKTWRQLEEYCWDKLYAA